MASLAKWNCKPTLMCACVLTNKQDVMKTYALIDALISITTFDRDRQEKRNIKREVGREIGGNIEPHEISHRT